MSEENNIGIDSDMKKEAIKLLDNIPKLITNNPDGTYTIKMPHGVEDYTIKDLTNREEQSCKNLATKEIDEDDRMLIRSIVSPKIKSSEWLDSPSKIKKRLEQVRRFLDGDFDFLV